MANPAFSKRQQAVLRWWTSRSPYRRHDAIICDGAIRSGKTFSMGLSFVVWAMLGFSDAAFALCGRTLGCVRRNLLSPLLPVLASLGFHAQETASQNLVEISYAGRHNRFYLFGGNDESSAARIQGVTLSGALFDEVALLPRSFVEQALARCSVRGSKFWFNCNPEHPGHWFYQEWILKRREKRALYLHFTMRDNPALSPEIIRRYENIYSGAFYERFVLGRWSAAAGAVYPMFSPAAHVVNALPQRMERYLLSCDYGIVNPCSAGLWGLSGGVWYRMREYYYDAKAHGGVLRTDEEHYKAIEALGGGLPVREIVVDPSAASLMETVRSHGRFLPVPADNQVLPGIRAVAAALDEGKIKLWEGCVDSIREFSLYRWDEAAGADRVVKRFDHAMDDIRYFVMHALGRPAGGFFAMAADRWED
ncbi:PBSX family phage terminase large subunit [Zongyangia hominis]|uniref:PBSX family phage terminase large subunit n=1 Tax=Zongyangia hominis TaxID=2763677 RepID=A0A926IBR0_9FIRM|nr:PBSX family phage terminase large subunit [Zongyangia hominis]MBC8570543.1 PBSX family phage terminase large subunit [Zongyangia hominis]